MPTRRITPPAVVVPAIILFGGATAVFVFLAVTWSRQLAIDSRFSAHTDGLRFSVYLAWIAAALLFLGTCAAVAELVRGRRTTAKWTFETRDRDMEVARMTVQSDAKGRFHMAVTGAILNLVKVHPPAGYRHFRDEDTADSAVRTSFYRLIAWGDLWYKTDADHPAIYVFVKDGVREVSALPCRGGWDSGGAAKFPAKPNQPAWPTQPSLKDVVQKQPTTAPGNHGGSAGP